MSNHYTADGSYLLDDTVPKPAIAYRIKLHGFGERFGFGIAFTNGVSDDPISSRELEIIKNTGMPYELIPIRCEHCAALSKINESLGCANASLSTEVLRLSEEIDRLKSKKH